MWFLKCKTDHVTLLLKIFDDVMSQICFRTSHWGRRKVVINNIHHELVTAQTVGCVGGFVLVFSLYVFEVFHSKKKDSTNDSFWPENDVKTWYCQKPLNNWVPAYPTTFNFSCLQALHTVLKALIALLFSMPAPTLHLANSGSFYRTQFRCHFLWDDSTDYTLCSNDLNILVRESKLWLSFIAVSVTHSMVPCCSVKEWMYNIHNPCITERAR